MLYKRHKDELAGRSIRVRGTVTMMWIAGAMALAPHSADAQLLDNDARKIHFQARLIDSSTGSALSGSHTLTFKLYDNPVVPVPLSGGVFDVSVTIATADDGVVSVSFPSGAGIGLPAGLLDGGALFLGVTIDASSGGTEMTPRLNLGVAPYAMRVHQVENEELTDDLALGSDTDSTAGTLTVFSDDNKATAVLDGGQGSGSSGATLRLGNDSEGDLVYISGDDTGRIELQDNMNQTTVAVSGGGSEIELRAAGGYPQVFLDGAPGGDGGGLIELSSTNNHFTTVRIDGDNTAGSPTDTDEGGSIELSNGEAVYGNTVTVRIDGSDVESGHSGDGVVEMYDQDGNSAVLVHADNYQDGPKITLGKDTGAPPATLPTVELIANENQEEGGQILIGQHPDGTLQPTIELDGQDDGTGDGGVIKIANGATVPTVILDGQDDAGSSGMIKVANGSALPTILLSGDGVVSVRDGSANAGVVLLGDGQADAGEIQLANDDGTVTAKLMAVDSTNSTNQGGRLALYRGTGAKTIVVDAGSASQAGVIKLFPEGGANSDEDNPTIELDAEYGDDGNGRIITQELEITGGSDLSEQFDVFTKGSRVEPGTVVTLDPENPGRLLVSSQPYDRRVAGIISGAGGVRPGMLMGQRGSIADGEYPVALIGRVWCRCDASAGAIVPGDLLTTSATPGHAMKASDPARTQGAVIGKAMTALSEGQGLVLVMVSMQ